MPVLDISSTEEQAERLYLFNTTEKLEGFLRSLSRYRLVIGAPGSGKTEGCKMSHFLDAMRFPGIKQTIFRKYRSDAVATVGTEILQEFAEHVDHYDRQNDILYWSPRRTRLGPHGIVDEYEVERSITYFRGFDEQATRKRYGSFNFAKFWMAEAHEMDLKDFETATERLRQIGDFPTGGILDAVSREVPDKHWIETLFLDAGRPDPMNHMAWEIDFRENVPNLELLGRGDYAAARLREAEGDELAMALNVEGKRPAALLRGPAVYPEYRPTRRLRDGQEEPWHYVPQPIRAIPNTPIHRGFDIKLTAHYFAAVWWQRQMGRVIVLRSLTTDNASMRDFAQRVKSISSDDYPGFRFIDRADRMILEAEQISGRKLTPQIVLAEYGITASPGEQSNYKRKEIVRDLLTRTIDGSPMLIVSGKAVEMHRAMSGGYCMVKDDKGVYSAPAKNEHSHCVEALEHSVAYDELQLRSHGRSKPLKVPVVAYR